MEQLTKDYIKEYIAQSKVIYKRGENIFHVGNYTMDSCDLEGGNFSYTVDGNYGNYIVTVYLGKGIRASCTCPYPYKGCKHIVAVCLDIADKLLLGDEASENIEEKKSKEPDYLTYDEIRNQVIENRKKSSQTEDMEIVWGETCKGEHLVITKKKKQYTVTIHDPGEEKGHCTCPDFTHNRLFICKHFVHVMDRLKKKESFYEQGKKETMPFIHLYWDSYNQKPCYYYDRKIPLSIKKELDIYFSDTGLYKKKDTAELYKLILSLSGKKNIKIDGYVKQKVENYLFLKEMFAIKKTYTIDYSPVKATLYPYQKAGVEFSLFKTRAIIADEMGLGKTLQAITIALLKKEIFGFQHVLVVCPASLKEQWKREIERFTSEKAVVVAGSKKKRQQIYEHGTEYFFITNYEAVLRDIFVIRRVKPDLVILDEAQRIKNFETKTHQAILSLPRKQSLVITGTPLENKLEDLYSLVQFSDPELLSPLWIFTVNHLKVFRGKRHKIAGYKNLDVIHEKLKNLVIRRTKEEVLDCLPEQVTNTYYIDLTEKQRHLHQGYVMSLLPILNKKVLTPFDIQTIFQLLLCMRMVCDSTYLIDRKTNLSPKLAELEKILLELVKENNRKVVIFSEWTTMTFLIGKLLSSMKIPFIEFTGKIPADKRQKLINEFTSDENCKVFVSSDAGGVGLNLQAADCIINFELPWNPAKLNQRIGRINRIGQKSSCINVINLIAKNSIEENVLAGISLKQELFDAVIDGKGDEVDFTREKKTAFINRLRAMFNEEQILPARENYDKDELPDSTPYYLNPGILTEEQDLDFTSEEQTGEDDTVNAETGSAEAETEAGAGEQVSPEKMEEVLENGMKFLSGLTAMATGQSLVVDDESKMVHVDKQTGEVTLKFKLAGFSPAGKSND